jgi:hypothetical protein
MEIIDSRHVTPDQFSIDNVRVVYDWSEREPKYVSPYLIVSLKPEGYMRSRFSEGGASYETKKHGARELRIRVNELKQMMDAFSEELKLCHQLLLDHGLMSKLAQARWDMSSRETSSAQASA